MCHLHLMLFRLSACCSAKLQGGEPITVLNSIHMWRIPVKAFAHHPSYFAMIIDPCAQEFRTSIHYKITGHLLPGILKFIMVAPNIIPCPGYDILASLRYESSGTRLHVSTHIPGSREDAQVVLRERSTTGKSQENKY